MEKRMASSEVRQNFSEVLRGAVRGENTIIELHGRPVAALVPIESYHKWQHERERLFDLLREGAERAALDEEAAMALALEAQRAVRAGE